MNRSVSQTAKILGVDSQQVKKWAWLFRDHLGNRANPAKGLTRTFTDTDVLVLIHVAMRWEANPDIEAIQYGLDGHYEHYRHFLYENTPILQEPPEDLDETWTHGLLLNGPVDGVLELARNYKRVADALLDSALKNREVQDWGYPIFFGYRHALELYLKVIGRIEKDIHSLKKCVELIEKRYQRKIGSSIRGWILEFDQIDPYGTTFRYADDDTLKYAELWVDFPQLKYAMGVIFETLNSAVWEFEKDNDLPVPSWLLREQRQQSNRSRVP